MLTEASISTLLMYFPSAYGLIRGSCAFSMNFLTKNIVIREASRKKRSNAMANENLAGESQSV